MKTKHIRKTDAYQAKMTGIVLVLLCFLCGCTRTYHLHEGMYVPASVSENQEHIPYILIRDGQFTAVVDSALSFQPDGEVKQEGNTVILEAESAPGTFYCVFELTDENTMRFVPEKSEISRGRELFEQAGTFTSAD